MRGPVKYILLVCCLLTAAGALRAQTPPPTSHDPNFNALDYSLQKRYKAKDALFVNNKFTDNTFLSAYWGTGQTAPSGQGSYSWGGKYTLAAGKWFTPDHALRLSLVGDTFRRNFDGYGIFTLGLNASYLFRISSYVNGYSRSRVCEFSLVGGLGAEMSLMGNTLAPMGNVHVGFNASVKLSRDIDFIIEPLAYFRLGNLGNYGSTNWKDYNFSYGVNAGLHYNFIPSEAEREKPDYRSDVFISLMGGAQFQNGAMMYATVGLWKSIGPHAALSVGKKFTPFFALRPSLFYSHDIWGVYLEEFPYKTYYGGVRMEAMLEFLHFAPRLEDKMALSLIAGPEFGVMWKEDVNEEIIVPYLGVSAGIQYKFKLAGMVHAFVEPRLSIVPYNFSSSGSQFHLNKLDNYFDCLFNLNVGIEVDI